MESVEKDWEELRDITKECANYECIARRVGWQRKSRGVNGGKGPK